MMHLPQTRCNARALTAASTQPLIPAHSASSRAFTPVFDGLWTRVNALMLGTHNHSLWNIVPRNGVPATHSASQTRVNALLLSRGAPRGGDVMRSQSAEVYLTPSPCLPR